MVFSSALRQTPSSRNILAAASPTRMRERRYAFQIRSGPVFTRMSWAVSAKGRVCDSSSVVSRTQALPAGNPDPG